MTLHVVLTERPNAELGARIQSVFSDSARRISDSQWLVSAELTDKGLCERLGATNGEFGRLMVATIGSYYGWHDRDLWNWISLKEDQ